jgi:hypothetical protein
MSDLLVMPDAAVVQVISGGSILHATGIRQALE